MAAALGSHKVNHYLARETVLVYAKIIDCEIFSKNIRNCAGIKCVSTGIIREISDQKKTKFSTWLGNYVRYKCLDFLNESNFLSVAQPKEALIQINKRS